VRRYLNCETGTKIAPLYHSYRFDGYKKQSGHKNPVYTDEAVNSKAVTQKAKQ